MHCVRVRTASGAYPAWVGLGAARKLPRLVRGSRAVFVIASRRVWARWGGELRRALSHDGAPPEVLLFEDSERRKTMATAEELSRQLVRRGADREVLLVAVGGGVVGDVAGFVAATFLRGVVYGQVATTLVAQIDSAIGGKTGVNLPEGKNLVGSFYQPSWVVADTRFLRTLPAREFRAGFYELIKYGVIADVRLFAFLEENLEELLALDASTLERAMRRAMEIKAQVVGRDEREAGLRRILNLGHTIGHALEALAGYGRLRHGEAVAWGMIAATRLARDRGMVKSHAAERIERLIRRVGRLPLLHRLSPAAIYAQMFADKKRRGGAIHFVLPVGIGRVRIVSGIERAAILAVCRSLQSETL